MRYLLYLPGIILMLLPILSARSAAKRAEEARREQEAQRAAAAERQRCEAERQRAIQAAKAAEREAARAAREAEAQRKREARLEAARQRAEYAERELTAKREIKALERAKTVPAAAQAAEPAVPAPAPRAKGNDAFKGQVVAFTGRLPGMTRRVAIRAVQDNGGRAYETMPAGTTLLVVGDKPGMGKLDKADEWIGQVRKITAAQFFAMLKQPLTLELDEFAAKFAEQFSA